LVFTSEVVGLQMPVLARKAVVVQKVQGLHPWPMFAFTAQPSTRVPRYSANKAALSPQEAQQHRE